MRFSGNKLGDSVTFISMEYLFMLNFLLSQIFLEFWRILVINSQNRRPRYLTYLDFLNERAVNICCLFQEFLNGNGSFLLVVYLKLNMYSLFFKEADLDGDGNVNYEEFVTMIFKVGLFNVYDMLSSKGYWQLVPIKLIYFRNHINKRRARW